MRVIFGTLLLLSLLGSAGCDTEPPGAREEAPEEPLAEEALPEWEEEETGEVADGTP